MHRKLIDLFSRLVPQRFRSDWRQEWEAELHHREQRSGSRDLTQRSLGAFWDALAMQPRRLEEELFQDIRYGIRMLAKNKGLTITAVLSLALGIGANTALFSMVDAVLIKKLPVKSPDELVLFQWAGPYQETRQITTDRSTPPQESGDTFSLLTFEEFRGHNETLSSVFAFAHLYQANVIAEDRAEVATGQYVSGGFFSGLGVGAAFGRVINNTDDRPSAAPAVVISHRYWQNRFGSDRNILGKSLKVNGAPFTIIGVTPVEFAGTVQVDESPDVYIPLSFVSVVEPRFEVKPANVWWLWVMGRVKPGVTLDQVRGNLEGILQATALNSIRVSNPAAAQRPDTRLEVVSGSRGLVDHRQNYSQSLLILMTLVGLVLLVACANVANLLLARATARQNEIAVRLTMGASRLRLIRQLLTESVLLAACGGVAGTFFAYAGKDALLRLGPWNGSNTVIALQMDLRVLAFMAIVSLLTGIVFGIVPALGATRRNVNSTMKESSRNLISRRSYLGKVLLIVQVALSVVLLIGAGLFVRTIVNFNGMVSRVDPASLLQFNIDPTLNNYDVRRAADVLERVAERVQSLPGAQSVTLVGGNNIMNWVDRTTGRGFHGAVTAVRFSFFETMGISLLSGRTLLASDDQNAAKVAVVNETFARLFFANDNPLGQSIGVGEIVGVVRDTKYTRLREDVYPTVFVPYPQSRNRQMTVRVRTSVPPALFLPAIREAVAEVDPHLPFSNVRTLADQINQSLARERMFAGLSSFLGMLALTLTCVGFYGIMTYNVTRRTNEIGIRMALGARRFDVLRLIMSEGLIVVLIGAVIGVAAALASARFVAGILFGLAPNDAATIAAAVAVMVAVAAIAAFIPARRASRVDPQVALRYE